MENNIKQIVIEIDTEKQNLSSIYWNLNKWVSSEYINSYRTLEEDEKIQLWTEEELKQMNINK